MKTERNAKMIRARMNGQTYEQIAFAFGITKQRVHHIVKRGLKPRRSILDDIHPQKLRAAMRRAREGMGATAIARRYGLTNYQAKKIMEVVNGQEVDHD